MSGRIRVDWDGAANEMSNADARNTKNAVPVSIDGKTAWITWPDRLDRCMVNGISAMRCRICGELWEHGECECEVARP